MKVQFWKKYLLWIIFLLYKKNQFLPFTGLWYFVGSFVNILYSLIAINWWGLVCSRIILKIRFVFFLFGILMFFDGTVFMNVELVGFTILIKMKSFVH